MNEQKKPNRSELPQYTYQHEPIFFVTVYLAKTIHEIGQGFTTTTHKFVCAPDGATAAAAATKWLTGKQCEVSKATAIEAVHQDVRTYTFPEAIVNLPRAILRAEYDRRKMPESYRDPGQYVSLP